MAHRGDIDEAWERARAEGIHRMVATEPGVVWADGHTLFTLGSHTGHTMRPIAFFEDAAWASAIAQAIEARRAETAQQAPSSDESAVAKPCAQKDTP